MAGWGEVSDVFETLAMRMLDGERAVFRFGAGTPFLASAVGLSDTHPDLMIWCRMEVIKFSERSDSKGH
eukprot:6758257-Prorocentrum_lima.AAC.1